MFERVSRAAEQVATGVSRRGFLGRLGQGALAVAGLLAGGFGSPAAAQTGGVVCCVYYCSRSRFCGGGHYRLCLPAGSSCPGGDDCCYLTRQYSRRHCNGC